MTEEKKTISLGQRGVEIKTIDEYEIYEKVENKSREFLQSTGHLKPNSRYLTTWKYVY